MCLGTVILASDGVQPEQRLTDVVSIAFSDGRVQVQTLFDERHDLQGVMPSRIELSRGVTITLVRSLACKEPTP